MEKAYRPLTSFEKSLLDKLLAQSFDGVETLRKQLEQALVRNLETGDNYGSIEFLVKGSEKADVSQRVPVEMEAYDTDDVAVEVLLHVVDGKLDELEFLRVDGSPLQSMPTVEEFKPIEWETLANGTKIKKARR